MVEVHENTNLVQVLDDNGKILPSARTPDVSDELLTRVFEKMLLVRVMDERMMRLQRQGRLGFYMKSIGEEASHFAVAALRESDWVYPSYREQGAWFWRGYTVDQYISQLFGNEFDPVKGRQMPVHHSANWANLVSISSPVGTQIPQAVGTAHAARLAGKDDVVVVYFGEGTSSTGAFHVGLNFAGVLKAPVIFICRNNGYAISVPKEKQTAAKTFASKGVGYGMPGVLVDGNDMLATMAVMRDAVRRARAGEGPTLIEARTYRIEGHSSSDDPSVYRSADEPALWEKKDPLKRLRGYLEGKGLWKQTEEDAIRASHNKEIDEALAKVETAGDPPLESIFDDVYEELPWNLREQKQYLMAQERVKSPHKH